jgi:acyl-coenzyme A synthetase/AMP-(fatty) acid ligase
VSNALYLRWTQIAAANHERPAVFGESGGILTFAGLAAKVAALGVADGPVVARSGGAGFLVATLQAWRDGVPVVPVERDAPAPPVPTNVPAGTVLAKFTTGSSGVPRYIYFTASQVAADAAQIVTGMGLTPERVNLAVISAAHSYGFSSLVLPLLLFGVALRIVPVPFPDMVAKALSAHPRVTLAAVPTMWRAWLRAGILNHPDALCISAGAPLALDLEAAIFARFNLKVHNFYGTSECGGISYDPTPVPRSDPRDAGLPLPGVVLDTSQPRLRVISAATATGYEFTIPGDDLGNGAFLTHDFAKVDGGRVMLLGTDAASINVAGRKVSPAAIEAAVRTASPLSRVKVFGIPSNNPERVEEIVAAIAPPVELAALKTALAAALPSWEFPRHWWIDPPADLWNQSTPQPWALAWTRKPLTPPSRSA